MFNKHFNQAFNQIFLKKFYLSKNINVNFFFYKNQKILILKNKTLTFYFVFPLYLDILFQNYSILVLKNLFNLPKVRLLYKFLANLNESIKQLKRAAIVTFVIKGIGLKINLVDVPEKSLCLKFGYSHLIWLPLAQGIMVVLFKKKIILCGFSKMFLGNFASNLYKYKPINIFTGKGLFKKQKKKFKLKEYIKKL